MNSEIAFIDSHVGPDSSDELVLAQQSSRPSQQRDQDVERATAKSNRRISVQQQALICKYPERPEAELVAVSFDCRVG